MSQAIRLRVRSHDAYQIEFKIDYRLLPDRTSRYAVDIYLFIPHSLDINSRTYFQTDFYRDAKHYVRLRTPHLELDTLATSSSSPLATCEEILNTPGWQRDEQLCSRLATSIKVIRPVLNASLRAHVRSIASAIAAPSVQSDQTAQVERLIQQLLTRMPEIIGRYRALRSSLPESGCGADVAAIYRLTDEAISIVVEDALVQMYRILDDLADKSVADRWQKQIMQQNECELGYRRAQQFETALAAGKLPDDYLHRASLLKKFTISALYLTTAVSREGTTTEQLLYAMAAGLSMVFATVVAFYFQARFGMLTFPLFMALVVAYMFKDRIKEIGRVFFSGFMRRYFFDQRTVLHALDGRAKLGYVREKMDFVSHWAIPPAVLEQRHQHLPQGVHSFELEEEVLHYSKRVLIDKDTLRRIDVGGLEITGVRDIMRYNIRPYLRYMAAPLTLKRYLDEGQLQTVSGHKTYQLYCIIEYRSGEGKARTRLRSTVVHMDRNGILTIRPAQPGPPRSDDN